MAKCYPPVERAAKAELRKDMKAIYNRNRPRSKGVKMPSKHKYNPKVSGYSKKIKAQIEEAQEEEKVPKWMDAQCAAEICTVLGAYMFELNDSATRSSVRMRVRRVLDRYSELENVRIECSQDNNHGRALKIRFYHPKDNDDKYISFEIEYN